MRTWLLPPVLLLSAGILVGCVTEPSARHRDVPSPPADARATSIQLFAAAPRDTNANGYGDTLSVTVYLFDEQRYPLPLALPGAMRFDLRTSKGASFASWSFTAEQVEKTAQPMAPGPGYRFELSLLDKGGDVLEGQEAMLSAEFTPPAGPPVRSQGAVAMRIGRVSP